MAETRKGEVTFKGNPITLVGPKLKPGDKAPDFTAVGAGLASVSLGDTAGKARLFNVVPSLDTPVCNKQTKRFAEELKSLGDDPEVGELVHDEKRMGDGHPAKLFAIRAGPLVRRAETDTPDLTSTAPHSYSTTKYRG